MEIGPDNLPADPRLRRIAHLALGSAYHVDGSAVASPERLVAQLMPWWARDRRRRDGTPIPPTPAVLGIKADMPAVVDVLLRSGRISLDDGKLRYAHPAEYAETPLPREAMLAAFADRMASRLVEEPSRRAAVRDLFLDLRSLHRVHSTEAGGLSFVGDGPAAAVLVPAGIEIDLVRGPWINGACLVSRDAHDRLVGGWVPPEAMDIAFPVRGKARVEVDLDLCRSWPHRQYPVSEITLSAMPGRPPFQRARGIMEPRWIGIPEARAAATARLGFDMGAKAWLGFSTSVRRSRGMEGQVTRMVLALVPPEVRRACLRSPHATAALADWFVAGGAEARVRRLQASASYPILTPYLHLAKGEIDAGARLAPAISAVTGLSPRLVRHVAGRHWQSIGKGYHQLASTPAFALRASRLADAVPPERLPVGRIEWQGFFRSAGILHDWLGGVEAGRLALDASADWGRLGRIMDAGLADALSCLCGAVLDATSERDPEDPFGGMFDTRHVHDARSAVVRSVVGAEGGCRRLEGFNDAFHRTVATRAAAVRAVEDAALDRSVKEARLAGVAIPAERPEPRWEPLTEGGFACRHGSLAWVTDVEGLAAEGQAMRHCVATREHECRGGGSHVAVVIGSRGGRSTVEVALRPRQGEGDGPERVPVVVEHKSAANAPPPEDCAAVVAGFMDTMAGSVDADAFMLRGKPYRDWRRLTQGLVLTPDDRLAILRIHEACLPQAARGLSHAEWSRRILEARRLGEAVPDPPEDERGALVNRRIAVPT